MIRAHTLAFVTLLASLPAAARAATVTPNPAVVTAGGSVTVTGAMVSDWRCNLSAAFFPPYAGIQYRFDLYDDNVIERDWSSIATYTVNAASIDGPATITLDVTGRCAYFELVVLGWVDYTEQVFGSVQVLNAAPTVSPPVLSAGGDPANLALATAIGFSVTGADPEPADTLTYAWAWSDGVTSSGREASRTFAAAGTYTATVTVTDDDGGSATSQANFTAVDSPPVITVVDVAAALDEGDATTLRATAVDTQPIAYAWRVTGPGGYDVTLAGRDAAWIAPDEGTFTATVSATAGGVTVSRGATVAVGNVAPAVTPTWGNRGVEGQPFALSASISDPGPTDAVQVQFDVGDGSGFGPLLAVGVSASSTVFPDDGTYDVQARATDGDGGVTTEGRAVQIDNADPVLVAFDLGGDAVEGAPFTVSALATDVASDPLTYAWEIDGVTYAGPSATATLPSGTYRVRLRVEDDDGGRVEAEGDVLVLEAGPAISATLPVDVVEGVEATFLANAVDPGGDAVTYLWTFPDGAQVTGPTARHAFPDDGPATVVLRVEDAGGGATTGSYEVLVANAPPALSALPPATTDEGDSLDVSAFALDVPADPVAYTWFVDGAQVGQGASLTLPGRDDGTYALTVEAEDGDGGFDTVTALWTVRNLPPSVDLTGDTDDLASSTLAFVAEASDPGGDALSWAWDWGDGTADLGGPGASHAWARNGTYTVIVTVTDDDGASSSATLEVSIQTHVPEITSLNLPLQAEEGSAAPMSCDAVDAGQTGALAWSWTFGDGGTSAANPTSHAWVDEGAYTVICTVADGSGAATSAGGSVEVTNVAPTIRGTPSGVAIAGVRWTFSPSADDPGTADVLTWSISPEPGLSVDPATGAVTWDVPPGAAGPATLTLFVSDGDGGSDEITWTVEVGAADLDGDGMADLWEVEQGLNPNDPADAALDPDGDGRTHLDEFLGGTDPFQSEAPRAPILVSPVGDDIAFEARPPLTAAPDGPTYGALTWRIRVATDPAMSDVVIDQSGLAGPAPAGVAWQPPPLDENARYWWTASVDDGFAVSPEAAPTSFRVDALAEPPGAPSLSAPVEGATLPTLTPTLEGFAATDPDPRDDGAPLEHSFTITRDDGTPIASSPWALPAAGAIAWTVDPPRADGEAFCFTAVARGLDGVEGPAAPRRCVTVDLTNLAPSTPEILVPSDAEVVPTNTVYVQIANGVDPEGRGVFHRFELDVQPTFDSATLWTVELPADPSGVSSWVTPALTEDLTYHLRVAATDGAAWSAWSAITFRVDATNGAPPTPVLFSPEDGTTWSFIPDLRVAEVVDPEGDAVTYVFELTPFEADPVLAETGDIVYGLASWTPSELVPGAYTWRVAARDARGATSAWSEPWGFFYEGPRPPGPNNRDPGTPPDGALPLLAGCGGCAHHPADAGAAWVVALGLAAARRRSARR